MVDGCQRGRVGIADQENGSPQATGRPVKLVFTRQAFETFRSAVAAAAGADN